jgi:RimJ/RimL family protein N-acetyltransferase
MPNNYATTETLRDGKQVVIRALQPRDRDELVAAAGRISPKSLFRRFFGPKRTFSKQEIEYFTNIDFKRHVALIALQTERGREVIIGSGRYILTEPTEAEVAFTVADAHQGRGIGSALLRHLAGIARGAGVKTLVAEVLPENTGMLKVFERSGMPSRKRHERGSVRITMELT